MAYRRHNNNKEMMRAAWLVLIIACFLIRKSLAEETLFDVMKYGAKADGQNDDATAFIKAWKDACDSTGGPATVVIPPGTYMAGEVVFAGPCKGPGPVTISIQGNITANDDPSSYTQSAWIMVERVDNVVVTGGGTINGKGSAIWEYAAGGAPLAVTLVMQTVANGKLNNLTFIDSMGFHTKVTDSHDVVVEKLTITAPGDSPNTDGIHLSNATNVNITDTVIGSGDDCVSIGHGSVNVLVTRVTCGPGHGISIGSLGKRENEMNVKGVTVSNCTITGTTNGARIKTYHGSPEMEASGIIYQDIVMDKVKNPIIIDQHYHSDKIKEESKVKISDTHFINIKGTSVSPIAILLNCSPTHPCDGIELSDIDLEPDGSIGPLKSACAFAKTDLKGTVNPQAPAQCENKELADE